MNREWILLLLRRELQAFSKELELFPAEDLMWETLPGVSNSAGNLALHVCGNLQYYIGAVLGGTGYVRDRPREFASRGVPRADLQVEIQRTIQVLEAVVPALSDEVLSGQYPDVLGGIRPGTGLFILHLSAHLAHHLGQVGYLRRMLTGENLSSGALSMQALTGPESAPD